MIKNTKTKTHKNAFTAGAEDCKQNKPGADGDFKDDYILSAHQKQALRKQKPKLVVRIGHPIETIARLMQTHVWQNQKSTQLVLRIADPLYDIICDIIKEYSSARSAQNANWADRMGEKYLYERVYVSIVKQCVCEYQKQHTFGEQERQLLFTLFLSNLTWVTILHNIIHGFQAKQEPDIDMK